MSSIIKVNTVQDVDGNNIINENANTITIGKSGDTVQVASGASLVGAGLDWQSSIVTAATLTAVAGRGYWIDTSSNACTVTLPGSASVGDELYFVDYARNFGTNALTINQNSLNYQGNSSPNPVYNTDGQAINIVYSGATKGWIPTTDDDVNFKTAPPYSANFLVIAGGGAGGGSYRAGGGGAGGFRASFNSETSGGGGSSESALTFNVGTVYTVTVGSGGSGNNSTVGGSGVASSISGSDITDITTVGGGGGASYSTNNAAAGGSGGGAAGDTPGAQGGSGTANQGYAGGNFATDTDGGAGGGGAGAVGFNTGNGGTDGDGGTGVASTISGSSVTRGGGGGAGNYGSANVTVGGAGGGGAGGSGAPAYPGGISGTANTGGGGGGSAGLPNPGGNGGSGVVILRVATSDYSGTTTGSPTVSTSGSDTVMVFNSSGSYTG